MYDKQVWKNKAKHQQSQEQTDLGINSIRWQKVGISLRQQNHIAVKDIFNEKRKCCNHRCPDSVYFHTLLLIMYFSAIKTLICHRETSLIGSTSFSFAQNTIQDFQNTVLNSWWHLS